MWPLVRSVRKVAGCTFSVVVALGFVLDIDRREQTRRGCVLDYHRYVHHITHGVHKAPSRCSSWKPTKLNHIRGIWNWPSWYDEVLLTCISKSAPVSWPNLTSEYLQLPRIIAVVRS